MIPLQHLIELDELEAIDPPILRGDVLRAPVSLRDEVDAKAKSVTRLLAAGMEADLSVPEEEEASRKFYQSVQQVPISPAKMHQPGVILKLSALLTEYDHEVVHEAASMRKYVTNRLFEETDPKGKTPKALQIRALELLGKITEVGLFTERSEITVKTLPQEQLEARLYEKLKTLLPSEVQVTDITPTNEPD